MSLILPNRLSYSIFHQRPCGASLPAGAWLLYEEVELARHPEPALGALTAPLWGARPKSLESTWNTSISATYHERIGHENDIPQAVWCRITGIAFGVISGKLSLAVFISSQRGILISPANLICVLKLTTKISTGCTFLYRTEMGSETVRLCTESEMCKWLVLCQGVSSRGYHFPGHKNVCSTYRPC